MVWKVVMHKIIREFKTEAKADEWKDWVTIDEDKLVSFEVVEYVDDE